MLRRSCMKFRFSTLSNHSCSSGGLCQSRKISGTAGLLGSSIEVAHWRQPLVSRDRFFRSFGSRIQLCAIAFSPAVTREL